MGASQVALLVKNPPASAGDVRDVHRNYLWGFCPLILSLFSFCYLEMVVFKDVFILSGRLLRIYHVLSLRRAWQLAVVFLRGKFRGQKNLVGYRP